MKDTYADSLGREAEAARSLLASILDDLDDVSFAHDLIEGETGLVEAVDAALGEIDAQLVIADGCDVRMNILAERKAKAKRRVETLRGLIEQALLVADQPTIKAPTGTVTVKQVAPKRIVTDEASVPSQFWKTPEPVLDKAALRDAEGDVAGTTFTNGSTSLTIRRV